MAGKTKKKTLPKDFDKLLETADLATLQAVFETCDVDARGGYAKQTALAFDACSDDLSRWLVSRGADLGAVDTWGNTPLHSRARRWRSNIAVLLELGADVNAATASIGTPLHAAADSKNAENARQLLDRGAKVDARNPEGLTPLELALRGCTNAELDRMPAFVKVMLDAGATQTPAMKGFVGRVGQTFEFHREGFNREGVAAASAALDALYAAFDVTPVPCRRVHDGTALIVVKASTWQKQHAELRDLLVPSSGPAKTVQGEVIRIADCELLEKSASRSVYRVPESSERRSAQLSRAVACPSKKLSRPGFGSCDRDGCQGSSGSERHRWHRFDQPAHGFVPMADVHPPKCGQNIEVLGSR